MTDIASKPTADRTNSLPNALYLVSRLVNGDLSLAACVSLTNAQAIVEVTLARCEPQIHRYVPAVDLAAAMRAEQIALLDGQLLEELLSAGQMLSNIAYNLKQRPVVAPHDREQMDLCFKRWDAARDKVRDARKALGDADAKAGGT